MNDQEIRMWAVEQVMNEWRDADLAIAEAQRLYLFVTGQHDEQSARITVRCAPDDVIPGLMAAGYSFKYRASI
jgi:peptidoglycan/xylan/chitin deacetylase (PgdA/CDA1 family)